MPRDVMILGCGRSGTSIFGELFEAIPGYRYFSEPDFEEILDWRFTDPVAIKVPRESSGFPAPNGLSFPIDTLLESRAEPPVFFWQVRHPLDAIASLKIGISNNWGHHPRPHDWVEWKERSLVEQCAHHWSYINDYGYSAVEGRSVVCKFEDMIAAPYDFAQRICEAVGVDSDNCAGEVTKWAERVQDSNNDKFVEAVTSRNYSRLDHSVRVGRWRENLAEEEIRAIQPIVKKAAAAFGYTFE